MCCYSRRRTVSYLNRHVEGRSWWWEYGTALVDVHYIFNLQFNSGTNYVFDVCAPQTTEPMWVPLAPYSRAQGVGKNRT